MQPSTTLCCGSVFDFCLCSFSGLKTSVLVWSILKSGITSGTPPIVQVYPSLLYVFFLLSLTSKCLSLKRVTKKMHLTHLSPVIVCFPSGLSAYCRRLAEDPDGPILGNQPPRGHEDLVEVC